MPRRLPKSCAFLLLLLPLPHITFAANFVFPDFNETIGLPFAGSAATTSCEVGIDLTLESGFVDLTGDADKFGEIHGKGDNKSDIEYSQQSEKYTMQGAQTISTNLVDDESGILASKLSSIGHRDDFIDSKVRKPHLASVRASEASSIAIERSCVHQAERSEKPSAAGMGHPPLQQPNIPHLKNLLTPKLTQR